MAIDLSGIPKGRVDNTQTKVGNQATDKASAASKAGGVQPGGQDTVRLSSEAQSLHTLERIADQTPDINQEKVDAIKRALDNGEYQVDNAALAQNMLNSEFDF